MEFSQFELLQQRAGQRRTWVDVYALPARCRVDAHDGMHRLDGLAADRQARCARAVRLCDCAVHGGEALKVLLEPWAERRIHRVAGTPERVAAVFGPGVDLEGRGARRLDLVRDVGVPELELGEGRGIGAARAIVVDD